jgi:DNA-binding FrmR family transcriptional regulator
LPEKDTLRKCITQGILVDMDILQKRISRISGQLRGIQKMVEDQRDGVEILQQVAAVKKAINGLTKEIVQMNLGNDLTAEQRKKLTDLFERAIQL